MRDMRQWMHDSQGLAWVRSSSRHDWCCVRLCHWCHHNHGTRLSLTSTHNSTSSSVHTETHTTSSYQVTQTQMMSMSMLILADTFLHLHSTFYTAYHSTTDTSLTSWQIIVQQLSLLTAIVKSSNSHVHVQYLPQGSRRNAPNV